MAKKQLVKISEDGSIVSGLYSDILQGLGPMQVCRASRVEFNDIIGKWTVEPTIGPFAGACLTQAFDKRSDALAAEVELLSEQHLHCLL